MNWTDCELAKRCSTLHTFRCLSGIRLAATPARGTKERRGATWTCPTQQWPSQSSFGALTNFPEGVAVALWGLELLWPLLASVFPKVPLAQAPWRQLGPNQRRVEASKGRAICGPGNHRVWLLAGVALQVR